MSKDSTQLKFLLELDHASICALKSNKIELYSSVVLIIF